MNNKIKIKKSVIGKQAGLEIPLFKLEIGSGKEEISVITGIHGNEISGLLVINKLITKLKTKQLAKKINIFPVTNLLGLILRQRENPLDNKDLNRSFPGNKSGIFSEQISHQLNQQLKNSSLVIDLHTFESKCPVTAILMNSGNNKTKNKSLKAIKQFNPEIIWNLNLSDAQEVKLSGSLGPILQESGIPNFAIEMSPHRLIESDEINHVADGLERVVLNKKLQKGKEIPVVKRQKIFSQNSGVFITKKNLLDQVNENEIIGRTSQLPDFRIKEVKSKFKGLVLTIKNNTLINTGEQIAVIGKLINKL